MLYLLGKEDTAASLLKTFEHLQSLRKYTSVDSSIDVNIPVTVAQSLFLTNKKNKKRLILIRSSEISKACYKVRPAKNNADTLRVLIAIQVIQEDPDQNAMDTNFLIFVAALTKKLHNEHYVGVRLSK